MILLAPKTVDPQFLQVLLMCRQKNIRSSVIPQPFDWHFFTLFIAQNLSKKPSALCKEMTLGWKEIKKKSVCVVGVCVYCLHPLINVLQVKADPQGWDAGVSPPNFTAESVTSATTTQVTKVTKCPNICVFCLSNGNYFFLWSKRHGVSQKNRERSQHLTLLSCPQTVKGGYSETRIEKRIIITGDEDVDQHQVRTAPLLSQRKLLCDVHDV